MFGRTDRERMLRLTKRKWNSSDMLHHSTFRIGWVFLVIFDFIDYIYLEEESLSAKDEQISKQADEIAELMAQLASLGINH
jgi:hypothetical protein